MILTSTTATVPFTPAWHCEADGVTPRPGAPVFHLRAGDVIERGQLEAELAAPPFSAGRVYSFQLQAAIRAGVETLLADDPELERVLAIIDAEQEGTAEGGAGANPLSDADARLFAEIRKVLAGAWPDYADLLAQMARRTEVMPVLAFRRFCTGWENVKGELKRDRTGAIGTAAMRGIDQFDLIAAGNRAYQLLFVGDEEGN